MILKKPYAFLIKNFRIIHLILTGLIGYLFFKTYNLYSFFSRYAKNVLATLGDAIPSNYITIFMFLIAIVIIAFSVAMYLLMKKKDKPKKLYVGLSLYYVFYFIGLILCFALFKSMETNQLTIRNAMILRDFILIISIPQTVLFILSLIRGVGFDIKRFNFSKDLKELDIQEEDNEEFEFVFGVDSYKYARYLRRRMREFKYYVLENKLMFSILMALTGGVLLIVIVLNFTVYNRTYNTNQTIRANNLSLQVSDAYLTNLNYKGEIISEDKYFLIVAINFKNESGYSTVLNLPSYIIETKSGKMTPTLSRNSHFIDFGTGYAKEKIENGKSTNYILVYEMNVKDLAERYTMRIIDEIEYKAGTMNSKEKKLTLKPLRYIDTDEVGSYSMGEEMSMAGSILGDSSLIANSYEITNKVTYKYEACAGTNCRNITDIITADVAKSKKLLVLKGNLALDKNSKFIKNSKYSGSFFDAFAQVRYDGKISSVADATPRSMSEQYVLQVDEKIANAKSIELLFNIRNKRYVLKLK